ncbi:MAG: response regulator transcription factor [Brevinematia bacterium]
MKKVILLVEDDVDIVNLSKKPLEQEGFTVVVAMSVKFGIEEIKSKKPDLIILDLMLQDGDGTEVVKWVKRTEEFSNIPIIVLTAKSSEFDKVLLLELGADDYITKPFSIRELIARIKSILRRYETSADTKPKHNRFEDGGLIINLDSFEVVVDGQTAQLTKKEFEILELLIKNRGIVVSKEKILSLLWKGEEELSESSRTVDVHISKIKKKLGRYGNRISTIRGVGYRFQ